MLAQKNVDYIVIRTQVNLVMGIGTAAILTLLGVKYAVFWGFLAFLLGFIPNMGFWIAVVPPMLLAWFDLGWGVGPAGSCGIPGLRTPLQNTFCSPTSPARDWISPLPWYLSRFFSGDGFLAGSAFSSRFPLHSLSG